MGEAAPAVLKRSSLFWVGGRFAFSGLAMLALNLLVMRLYPATDVGALAVLVVVGNVLQLVSDFGISAACIQRRFRLDDRSGSQLCWLLLCGWATVWVVAASVTWLASGGQLAWMLLSLAACTPLLALRQLSVFTVEGSLRFAPTAMIELAETAVLVIGTLGLAAWGSGVWGFVIAFLAKCLVGWALARPLRSFRLIAVAPTAPAGSHDLAWFGLNYQTPAAITAARALAMPTVLGLLIGLPAVALVDRAIFIAGAPLLLLGAIQNRILFPYFSAHRDDPLRVRQTFERALGYSAMLDKPFFIALALLAAPLTARFLDPSYHDLPWLIWVILVPNITLGAFAFTCLPAMNGLGQARMVATINLASALASWLLLVPLVSWFGIWGAVAINLLLWINALVMLIVVRRLIPTAAVMPASLPPIIACAGALAVGFVYDRHIAQTGLNSAIIAVVLAWITYLVLLPVVGARGRILDLLAMLPGRPGGRNTTPVGDAVQP